MQEKSVQSKKLRGIIVPFIFSIIIGILIFYGGDAYRAIGLAGIGTAHLLLGYLLGIAEFLLLAVLAQRLVQYIVLDWFVASTIGSQPPRLLSQLSVFFIYLMAFTAIIGIVFKKDLTVVLAASGAAGIVVGMALQNLILDIFAGLAINLDRIVKIGDDIQLHKIGDKTIEGKVVEISWRTMQLLDLNCNSVIIPNRLVSSSTITNFSAPQPFLESAILVVLDGKIPVERAIRILKAATIEALLMISLPPDLPPPSVAVTEIVNTPKSVKYSIYIYVPFGKRFAGRNMVQQYVLKHLNFAGIRPSQQELPDKSYLATLIATTELFQGIDEKSSLLIATHARLRKIEPNTIVSQNGEIAETMFLLVEGLLTSETRRRIDTKPLPSKILGPGNLIGGTSMLMNDVYDSTVSAKTACLLFEADYQLLEKLFMQQPEAAYIIAQNVARLITTKEVISNRQWQIKETDIVSEVLRNLKRRFTHLK